MAFVSPNTMWARIVFVAVAVAVVWFGTFGLFGHMGAMKTDGGMGGCLFNIQSDTCVMSFGEHIAIWQLFTTTAPIGRLLILAIVCTVAASLLRPFREFSEHIASRWRLYIRQNPHVRLFNALAEEFARGILNRKIFAPAIM